MIPRLRSGFRQRAQFLACPEQPNEERLSNGPANASTFSCYRHRALFTAAQSKRVLYTALFRSTPSFVLSGVSLRGVSWPGALWTEAISAIRPDYDPSAS